MPASRSSALSRHLCLIGLCGTILCLPTARAADPAPAPAAAQAPVPAKAWNTDAAVRKGMEDIRQVMQANRAAIEDGKLGAADYQRLGEAVDKALAELTKTQKLAREDEKALHSVVMGDLKSGIELMRTSPKPAAQRMGALGVLKSLDNYARHFRHPGWEAGK